MTKQKNDFDKLKLNREYAIDYGIDFKNRILRITGYIGNAPDLGSYFTFDMLDFALNELEKEGADNITIKINSGGGEIYEALAMIGRMKSSPCNIVTEAYGHCMSAATLLLMAGDTRKLSKYCVTMYHEMGYGVSGQHEDVKEQVEQGEREMKQLASYYEDFSNKKARFWLTKMKKKEFYPTPTQMLEYGAIDEII